MAITINRKQRDALYQETVLDLSGTGDIRLGLDTADYEGAQRLRRRYEEDMRLLDDIGWEAETDRDEFEITMDPQGLARTLQRLNHSAGDTLRIYVVEPMEGDFVVRAAQAQAACGHVLAQLTGVDVEDPRSTHPSDAPEARAGGEE